VDWNDYAGQDPINGYDLTGTRNEEWDDGRPAPPFHPGVDAPGGGIETSFGNMARAAAWGAAGLVAAGATGALAEAAIEATPALIGATRAVVGKVATNSAAGTARQIWQTAQNLGQGSLWIRLPMAAAIVLKPQIISAARTVALSATIAWRTFRFGR
jgi:hypothetical protein